MRNTIKIQSRAAKALNSSLVGRAIKGTDDVIEAVIHQPRFGAVVRVVKPTGEVYKLPLTAQYFGKGIAGSDAARLANHPTIGTFLMSKDFSRMMKVGSGGALSGIAILRSLFSEGSDLPPEAGMGGASVKGLVGEIDFQDWLSVITGGAEEGLLGDLRGDPLGMKPPPVPDLSVKR